MKTYKAHAKRVTLLERSENPNCESGHSGIWGHREEVQRFAHEGMRLAEARLVRCAWRKHALLCSEQ